MLDVLIDDFSPCSLPVKSGSRTMLDTGFMTKADEGCLSRPIHLSPPVRACPFVSCTRPLYADPYPDP